MRPAERVAVALIIAASWLFLLASTLIGLHGGLWAVTGW